MNKIFLLIIIGRLTFTLVLVQFGEIRLTMQRGLLVEVLVLLTQLLKELMSLVKLFMVGLRPKQLTMLILMLRVR